ncbi:MAG: hypothetical protein HDR57_05695 [Treponema sp.]|nr:hypothetical protein [Treponema sp.]MBD5400107.1 hypothetical protein [Treponema sp.]
MDKQRLEERIQATATEIFSLAETARRDGREDFKSLKTKLAADIWKWCATVFGSKRTGNAGVEIMECINRSLSSFKGEATGYMNYIAAALKKEIRRAAVKTALEKRSLMRLSGKKQRKIKQFLRFAEDCGKDITNPNVQKLIAKECLCTVEEIAALAQYYARSFVRGDTIVSDDGEERLLWDTVPAQETMPDETVILKTELECCLTKIDKAFAAAQERTKPYLSALITHRLLVKLESAPVDMDNAMALLRAATFAKTEEAQKIIAAYQKGGAFCTQEDIAKRFGRDKTDASRTLKNFWKKCQLA